MPSATERCTALLAELVGHPTHNPGGDELALCRFLADALRARGADTVDVGEVPRTRNGVRTTGGYVFGAFGTPRTVVNVHIDTVPPNTGWTTDPFRAVITDDRIVGLGAADTKGAAAATLTALEDVTPRDVGFLFSGDEEAGSSVIYEFLRSPHAEPLERAIVCEPTARIAGVRHRGFYSFRASYEGRGGHSSGADRMPKPIVTMARLAVALDGLAADHLDRGPDGMPGDMKGLCVNVADIAGGVAVNVVPDRARLLFSLRPPPGTDDAALHRELRELCRGVDPSLELEQLIDHKPFATRDPEPFRALLADHVDGFGNLQFWTEAAAFASAGIDAVVVGPGDIAQAHAADEFVTFDDLAWAIELFTRVFRESAR